MPGHAVLGVVFCELDGVLAAPAKSGRADLQVFGLKGRRRGTESLEILDHTGLGLGGFARQHPGDHGYKHLSKTNGLTKIVVDQDAFSKSMSIEARIERDMARPSGVYKSDVG